MSSISLCCMLEKQRPQLCHFVYVNCRGTKVIVREDRWVVLLEYWATLYADCSAAAERLILTHDPYCQ